MLKIFFVLMFFFLCEGKPRLATCPGGGGDKRSSCGRWKKLGYCDPKKGSWRFMAASCPASCGLCQGLEKVNITECLQAHNSKRALHGAAPLTWDTSLARKAEAWASYLTTRNLFEHAPWSVRLAGENLNLRIKLGKTATCKDAVESWYLEWKDYPFQNPPNSVQDTEAPIGHFTQSCDSHRKANRRVSDSSDTPNDAAKSFVVLPYVKGVTERISKVLRHDMDFNHAAVVDKSGDYHKRLFLEAWHSQRDQNAGNEHIDIPECHFTNLMSYLQAAKDVDNYNALSMIMSC
ncbi:hypothetical protein ACROYT_G009933 [Oculina patagonica]